jgi:hypothetical protein
LSLQTPAVGSRDLRTRPQNQLPSQQAPVQSSISLVDDLQSLEQLHPEYYQDQQVVSHPQQNQVSSSPRQDHLAPQVPQDHDLQLYLQYQQSAHESHMQQQQASYDQIVILKKQIHEFEIARLKTEMFEQEEAAATLMMIRNGARGGIGGAGST